jgi:hypothetical protein
VADEEAEAEVQLLLPPAGIGLYPAARGGGLRRRATSELPGAVKRPERFLM